MAREIVGIVRTNLPKSCLDHEIEYEVHIFCKK